MPGWRVFTGFMGLVLFLGMVVVVKLSQANRGAFRAYKVNKLIN